MRRMPFIVRLRYAFDNTLAHGPVALVGWLALGTALMIVVATGIDLAIGGTTGELGPFQVFWNVLSQALTPNPVDASYPWQFLLVMLGVTLGSLFMVSLLIGVLNAAIEERVEALRRGRTPVLESGHIVILGWSEQIFTIIEELMAARERRRHSCIVVLGERDKVEMESEIRHRVRHVGRTRVVCRTGSPLQAEDLSIVSLDTASSIVVLSGDVEYPDIETVKTLLAIINRPRRRPEPYHIVAQIRLPRYRDTARMAGRDEVELVLAGDIVARIVAQTCRQSGLSVVYSELLDFAGDEIYFHPEPALVGRTYGEALLAYEQGAVFGRRPRGARPQLNPQMDTRLADGDELIMVARDEDAIRLSNRPTRAGLQMAAPVAPAAPAKPERTLLLGWNRHASILMSQLDHYVAPGSEVTVVADDPNGKVAHACQALHPANQSVGFIEGDTTDRHVLDGLGIESYQHVIVLAYSDISRPQLADARTMVTLLHLREIAEQHGHPFSIVSEILDIRNRRLVEVAQVDDFIVSDRFISLIVAQIAENKELNGVLEDLFDAEGSEIYLKPAEQYVEPGKPTDFYAVVEAAVRRGEAAIGYFRHEARDDPARMYGVVINPPKSESIALSDRDRVIVVAPG